MTGSHPRLLSAHDDAADIDFAGLFVEEVNDEGELVNVDGDTGHLAVSLAGILSLHSGVKEQRPAVRLEHWDQDPGGVPEAWEESDELPFLALRDGFMRVSGCLGEERPPVFRLGAPGRYRVRVCVTGRQAAQDAWASATEGLVSGIERWLLQFWADPAGAGALPGPPRTLLPARPSRSDPAIAAGMHAVATTGWYAWLSAWWPFDSLWMMFYRHGPVTIDAVPALFASTWNLDTDPPEQRWVRSLGVRGPRNQMLDDMARQTLARKQAVVSALGGQRLRTPADLTHFLLDIGVLTYQDVDGQPHLLPNKDAPSLFDLQVLSADESKRVEYRTLQEAHMYTETDIRQLVGWAPGRLTATMRQLADRLGTTVDDVRGGIRFGRHQGGLHFDDAVFDAQPDQPVLLETRRWDEPMNPR